MELYEGLQITQSAPQGQRRIQLADFRRLLCECAVLASLLFILCPSAISNHIYLCVSVCQHKAPVSGLHFSHQLSDVSVAVTFSKKQSRSSLF